MTPKEQEIKDFYDTVTFPGLYTANDISNVEDYLIYERYLNFIEAHDIKTILDVGCGSGYITNIIANHFPSIKIVALDFSSTINHGKQIAKEMNIKNVTWIQTNFLEYNSSTTFDLVLSNGSIHHMPEFDTAVDKVKSLSHNYIMIGLYNKYGKWMQRKIRPKFITECFELDQLKIPFELSFTHDQVLAMCDDLIFHSVNPSVANELVNLLACFNSSNGGLALYVFSKS